MVAMGVLVAGAAGVTLLQAPTQGMATSSLMTRQGSGHGMPTLEAVTGPGAAPGAAITLLPLGRPTTEAVAGISRLRRSTSLPLRGPSSVGRPSLGSSARIGAPAQATTQAPLRTDAAPHPAATAPASHSGQVPVVVTRAAVGTQPAAAVGTMQVTHRAAVTGVIVVAAATTLTLVMVREAMGAPAQGMGRVPMRVMGRAAAKEGTAVEMPATAAAVMEATAVVAATAGVKQAAAVAATAVTLLPTAAVLGAVVGTEALAVTSRATALGTSSSTAASSTVASSTVASSTSSRGPAVTGATSSTVPKGLQGAMVLGAGGQLAAQWGLTGEGLLTAGSTTSPLLCRQVGATRGVAQA